MKRFHLFFLTVLSSALIAGCNRSTPLSSNEAGGPTPGPGKFGMGRAMQGLGKSVAVKDVQSGADVNFNLGNIKGSTAFYFLLYNIGSAPITNVTINMADTHFVASPPRIDSLIPGSDLGMLPIIKVVAIHGTPFDGIGLRPLMPMGENKAILQVSGSTKTTQGRDTTITLVAGLDVTALVMNFSLRIDGEIQKDLFVCLGGKSFDTLSTFYNTGNTPITMTMYHWGIMRNKDTIVDSLSRQVAGGDSLSFRIGKCEAPGQGNNATWICINSGNVVYPPGMLFDQNGYMQLTIAAPLCDDLISRFILRALADSCADQSNELYLIDSAFVFWFRQGSCPFDIFSYTIYSARSLDSILCRRYDSKAGYQDQCTDQRYHDMLDTITANLWDRELGLGENHRVDYISLPCR